jgi:hypothetical protein
MRKNPMAENNSIQKETSKLKRELTLLPLFGLIYFTVCGGSFGVEPMVGWSGPGLTLLLLCITPIVYSIPNMLMVELNSMMPREGGYYHWIKQAFGPFAGFLAGWMNWVVAWVDVSIYPVLGAYYLGYFIPALRNGAVIGGMEVPAWVLSWIVALILIWLISYLSCAAPPIGLDHQLAGAVMLVPLRGFGGGHLQLDQQRGDNQPAFPAGRRILHRRVECRAVHRDVELHGLGIGPRSGG